MGARPKNTTARVAPASSYVVGESGWRGWSSTSDTVDGWGEDEWRVVLDRDRFVVVAIDDCCLIGDHYEIHWDGRRRAITPEADYGPLPVDPSTAPYSRGSVVLFAPAGEHLLRIRDVGALQKTAQGHTMFPAGFFMTISTVAPVRRAGGGSGARSVVLATRDGWGALVQLSVDRRDPAGGCAYLDVALVVRHGGGTTQRLTDCSADGRPVTAFRRLPATGLGSSIRGLSIRFCRVRLGPDCGAAVTIDLPAQDSVREGDVVAIGDMLALSLDDFMALKAARSGDYDWTDDGCSFPIEALKKLSDAVLQRFRSSCERHDWGYRNLGSVGPRGYAPTDAVRKAVDDRLLADMLSRCDLFLDWTGCATRAQAIYASVRIGGGKSFYKR